MSKKIVILMFLWSSVRAVSADLIIDKNDSHVSDVNVEVLLETAPVNAQKELLSHKSQLKKQLEQLYLKQLLAKMAKDEGLDKEPMNAARLQAIMDNALFLLKLDNKRKSNKKDYSKFAKQLYTIKKSNYKTVERVDAAHILIANSEQPVELHQDAFRSYQYRDRNLHRLGPSCSQKQDGELCGHRLVAKPSLFVALHLPPHQEPQ